MVRLDGAGRLPPLHATIRPVPRADAASTKRSSRRHFDRWTRSYEKDQSSRRLAALQHAALTTLALGPADRLIDVGCGTGAAVRLAASIVERAVGIDLSAGMIARGRELAASLPNVELLEGDAEALPFEDGQFTALLCTTSLHHYPAPERAVAEMARVLAPGGRMAIGDMVTDRPVMRAADSVLRRLQSSHVGALPARQIELLARGAGLPEPSSQFLWHDFYAIVSARKVPSG